MKAETNTTPTLDPLGEHRSYARLEADHAALEFELDALKLENILLKRQVKNWRDDAYELWGLLVCIDQWLRGDLPEATAQQFIDMIEQHKQGPTRE